MKTRASRDCHLWTRSERLQGQQQAAPEFDHCLLRKGRSRLEREEAVIGCVLVVAVSELGRADTEWRCLALVQVALTQAENWVRSF